MGNEKDSNLRSEEKCSRRISQTHQRGGISDPQCKGFPCSVVRRCDVFQKMWHGKTCSTMSHRYTGWFTLQFLGRFEYRVQHTSMQNLDLVLLQLESRVLSEWIHAFIHFLDVVGWSQVHMYGGAVVGLIIMRIVFCFSCVCC